MSFRVGAAFFHGECRETGITCRQTNVVRTKALYSTGLFAYCHWFNSSRIQA